MPTDLPVTEGGEQGSRAAIGLSITLKERKKERERERERQRERDRALHWGPGRLRDPEVDSTDILSAILESQRGIDIALFVVNGVVLMTVPTGSQRACHNNLGDAACGAAPQYMYRIP